MVLRCLIVDDNDRFLRVARAVLEREGINIVGVATNSAEAFRQADELRPDLTLIDIDLGNESGFDVARHIAEAGAAERPQVIFISAHDEEDFKEAITASPAVGYLPKENLSGNTIREIVDNASEA